MKVCIVSRGDIFPPNHGAAVKLYYTLKSLGKEGIETYFVSDDTKRYYRFGNGDKCENLKFPERFWKSRRGLIEKILKKAGIPEDDLILFHPVLNYNMWLRTLYVVKKHKIDILQAEFPAFAFPALFSKLVAGSNVILVEHNVEFQRMRTSSDITLRGLLLVGIIEFVACMLSNRVVVVSEKDGARLKRGGIPPSKVVHIPHGVDLKRFKRGKGNRIKKKYGLKGITAIFHGVLNYGPNKEAALEIVRAFTNSKINVLIVGNHKEKVLNELRRRGLNLPENVRFTGVVKRIEDYIKAADVAIVPLKGGGGSRLKILEYFAAQIPVISTEKGVEGLNISKGVLIENDVGRYPKIIENMGNLQRRGLVERAHTFVKKYDWRNISLKYKNLYEEVKCY